MNYKAIIFDMDGVLIDSEMHWQEVDRIFFGEYGIPFSVDWQAKFTGKSMRQNVQEIKQIFNLPHSEEELLQKRIKLTDIIYTDLALEMPGVSEFIQKIKKIRLKTSVASGSSLDRIEKIVDRFGWQNLFDDLVSSDHVNYVGKPAPDIYLCAAERLAVDPKDCVVLEDSVNGLKSAKAAGMSCVAVLDSRWSKGDYSAADLQVDSLLHDNLYKFIGLN